MRPAPVRRRGGGQELLARPLGGYVRDPIDAHLDRQAPLARSPGDENGAAGRKLTPSVRRPTEAQWRGGAGRYPFR